MAEDLLKKLEKEIKEKKVVCLAYLQLKYVPEHSLDEDYYIDFDISALNFKTKKIVLFGFTSDTLEVFRELYRKYGFILFCLNDTLNTDATLNFSGNDTFWLVPGKPAHLLIVKVKPWELYNLKLSFCIGCKYRSECTIGLKTEELPPLFGF